MEALWPWLAVAAMGALHGANPMSGWAFAAWSGKDGKVPTRVMVPIAVGHLASVMMLAAAVPAALQFGVAFDPLVLQAVAAGLLLALALRHIAGSGHRTGMVVPAGRTGLGLWSFIVGCAHGAGWMLVPALVPFCGSDVPAREITASGSLVQALAAVCLHLAAMLAATAAMAAGAQRAIHALWRQLP